MLTMEQKQARQKGIGGSDAAVVVGLSPFKSPYQLWCEKTGNAPPDDEETLPMKFGSLLEEPICAHYCDVTGRTIRRQPMTAHPAYPFMLANIDRQIVKDPRGPGILEIKTTNEWTGRAIAGVDELPDHYYIQAQHYLAVYDYAWASFAILIGTQRFVWFDVARHDDVIAELIKQEAAFWELVQSGRPPEIDGSPRTAELIKRMYPQDTGKVLTLDAPELVRAAQCLAADKAAVKVLKEQITKHENMLKSAIGDASEAQLPGFGSITWKRAKDSTETVLDEEKLKAEFPDAYRTCLVTKTAPGSRRFLLKPSKEKE